MLRLQPAPVIGVDLDNTIIDYDDVMRDLALQKGWITEEVSGKKEIRDSIRRRPDGQMDWQRLQAWVYGPHISRARLIDGVMEFFRRCRAEGFSTFIVSHKTEYAASDETRTNLRRSAMDWLEANRFFYPSGAGLRKEEVFFESIRSDKVARIGQLGCTHFIDDLEETFLEATFPESVTKLLYSPHEKAVALKGVYHARSWKEIAHFFFA